MCLPLKPLLLLLSHFSRVRLLATPWTAAHQAPPSMGFSRQAYWSGGPLPSTLKPLVCCICYAAAADRSASSLKRPPTPSSLLPPPSSPLPSSSLLHAEATPSFLCFSSLLPPPSLKPRPHGLLLCLSYLSMQGRLVPLNPQMELMGVIVFRDLSLLKVGQLALPGMSGALLEMLS